MSPQEQVARQYMERKGYRDIEPRDIEALDGQPCWYFLYALPEGLLELEVSWDAERGEWDTLVTTFQLTPAQ